MSVLDSFPSMEELFEQYRGANAVLVQEPRDEYHKLPEEYEDIYGTQFSYDLPLIIFKKPRAVPEPISHNVDEYYFNAGLGLGIHKKIGLVVVFHRDLPEKLYQPFGTI